MEAGYVGQHCSLFDIKIEVAIASPQLKFSMSQAGSGGAMRFNFRKNDDQLKNSFACFRTKVKRETQHRQHL